MKWLPVFIIINIIILHIARSSSLYCRMWMSCTRHNWSLGCSEAFDKQASSQADSTYLLHGQAQRPQNFPRSVKFFSASFISLLIWSIPSSMRSICSGWTQDGVLFFTYTYIYKSPHIEADEKERTYRGWGKKKTISNKDRNFSDIHCNNWTLHSRAAYPVPTCYMDIWKGHSISLNLLMFSQLPSCLGWYGSCHLQHGQVVLVRIKGW